MEQKNFPQLRQISRSYFCLKGLLVACGSVLGASQSITPIEYICFAIHLYRKLSMVLVWYVLNLMKHSLVSHLNFFTFAMGVCFGAA